MANENMFQKISNEEIKSLKLSHFFPIKEKDAFEKKVDMWGNISIYKKATNFSRIHVADVLPLK